LGKKCQKTLGGYFFLTHTVQLFAWTAILSAQANSAFFPPWDGKVMIWFLKLFTFVIWAMWTLVMALLWLGLERYQERHPISNTQ